jgi:hypothetical protein
MPRPVDSGGPTPPRHHGGARVAFGSVKTLGVRNKRRFEAVPALQGARSPLRPTGFSVDASSILFVVIWTTTPPWTQDSIWVGGSPLPNRDFHPARDAKLAWRDNAGAHLLPKAGAQRTLEAVRCSGVLDAAPALACATRSQLTPGHTCLHLTLAARALEETRYQRDSAVTAPESSENLPHYGLPA